MNEIVHTLSDTVLRYLVVGSVAALVLVLLALAFLKAARIRTPVYRHMVWLYCLIGIVGLPLIWLYGPKLTLAILPARAETHAALASPLAGPEMEESFSDARLTPARPLATGTPSARQEPILSWKTATAAVWLLGFSIMLTRLAVGWLRLRRICRSALPLQRSECPVGWASPKLRLCLTPQLQGPVCFGVFRPIILLPQDMYRGGSRENLRMVLTHELAHIERRDCWANLFQRIVEAVYFFHPLVWLASRQLTQEREEICDNHVLAEGVSADDYTTLLSHLGTQAVHTPYLQTVALFEGQLLARIRSLLDPARSRQTKLPWRVAAVCTVAALAGFLVFGSVRLAAQPSDRAAGASPGSPLSSSASAEQKPVQSLSTTGANSEKPEQPPFAARTFNSKLAFRVSVRETYTAAGWRHVGDTPSVAPLQIPPCWCWLVLPRGPVEDWGELAREMSLNKVPALALSSCTDSDLKHLADLKDLRQLGLARTSITDAGLEHLKGLTELETLNLQATNITDVGLTHVKNLIGLRDLNLGGTQITDAGLQQLRALTKLEVLNLVQTRITGAGLAHLKGLTGLHDLWLTNTRVTDAGLEHLKGLTGLRTLQLGGTQVVGQGLVHLQSLTGLEYLGLDRCPVTDANLVHIRGLTRLTHLSLVYTQITDAGLALIENLTALKELQLQKTQITDAGLERLNGFAALETLGLEETKITDAGPEHLRGLKGLRRLWLDQTQIGDKGLERLRVLPGLQELSISGTQITDAGLEHLQSLKGLRRLWLDNTQIGDKGLEHLKGLTELTMLEIPGTRVTDAGLEHLKGVTKLEGLYLTRTAVTDAGLKHLQGLTSLRTLGVIETHVTEAGAQQLKQSLPQLAVYREQEQATALSADKPAQPVSAGATLVFEDNFDNGLSKHWKFQDLKDAKGVTAPGHAAENGQLRLSHAKAVLDVNDLTDYVVRARFCIKESLPGGNGGFGIEMRVAPSLSGVKNTDYYDLVLDHDMSGLRLAYLYVDAGKAQHPAMLRFASCKVVLGQWYTLEFEVRGQQLRGYLDGKLLMEATDERLTKGRTRLSGVNATVLVDDFSVYQLP